jgi:hypothetical protein
MLSAAICLLRRLQVVMIHLQANTSNSGFNTVAARVQLRILTKQNRGIIELNFQTA